MKNLFGIRHNSFLCHFNKIHDVIVQYSEKLKWDKARCEHILLVADCNLIRYFELVIANLHSLLIVCDYLRFFSIPKEWSWNGIFAFAEYMMELRLNGRKKLLLKFKMAEVF